MTSEPGAHTLVEAFRSRWRHVNQMTVSFAETVPDGCWELSPHAGFAPFNKQLRHVVSVRGVYNDGLRRHRVDFARKHEHYSGGLTRPELLAGLAEQHVDTLALIDRLAADGLGSPIDLFGRQISTAEYLYTWVQHEAIHHGQWSLYAAHGGFPVPDMWRIQWGLGAGEV